MYILYSIKELINRDVPSAPEQNIGIANVISVNVGQKNIYIQTHPISNYFVMNSSMK